MIQKTYILDTNVYGEILIEKESVKIIDRIEKDRFLFIYGVDVIEHELYDVPTDKKVKGKIFRELVLLTYKSLIDEEIILPPLADYLASETYNFVNRTNGLRTPKLIDYFEFRKRYLK